MSERRTSPRLRLAFPVLIDGPFGLRRCVGRDLSSQGLFVETADPYPTGVQVRVTFLGSEGGTEMTWHCAIRHVYPSGRATPAGIGLHFLSPELDADDMITAARRPGS